MGGLAAVELGGTRCRFATGTASAVVERFEIPTGDPQPTLAALAERLHEFGPFRAMGIASFGPLRLDSGAADFGQLLAESKPGWNGVDVVSPFQPLADKFVLETDVGAAALGEQLQLGGRGTLAYVTVGTGIGGGLAVDGRVHHGQMHPEMGHLRVPHDGSFSGVCATHSDCWEGLASGPALAVRAASWLQLCPTARPFHHRRHSPPGAAARAAPPSQPAPGRAALRPLATNLASRSYPPDANTVSRVKPFISGFMAAACRTTTISSLA